MVIRPDHMTTLTSGSFNPCWPHKINCQVIHKTDPACSKCSQSETICCHRIRLTGRFSIKPRENSRTKMKGERKALIKDNFCKSNQSKSFHDSNHMLTQYTQQHSHFTIPSALISLTNPPACFN
ncbi:hypothetical protein ATANTOWER_002139 [Ataeniobius toweri]|uniref:Uncharacterized protein n=1 Tax=Ataeniobius toweri TaxID=208326 RepID=A0ABU7ALM9_9TELE|nr:hypothetical protein [Ataeniobius toweri]